MPAAITRKCFTLRDNGLCAIWIHATAPFVGETQVHGDHPLEPGDIIRIAQCQMAYVQDLSQAFAENVIAPPVRKPLSAGGDDTVINPAAKPVLSLSDSQISFDDEPATITHRRVEQNFSLRFPKMNLRLCPRLGVLRLSFAASRLISPPKPIFSPSPSRLEWLV